MEALQNLEKDQEEINNAIIQQTKYAKPRTESHPPTKSWDLLSTGHENNEKQCSILIIP